VHRSLKTESILVPCDAESAERIRLEASPPRNFLPGCQGGALRSKQGPLEMLGPKRFSAPLRACSVAMR
jgi:hypothetical protein